VSDANPLRIAHVVLSMDVGGLERNVLNQIRVGPRHGQEHSVICLERPGELARQAEDLGARLVTMGKLPGIRPATAARVAGALRGLRPDVVHTHQIGALLYAGPGAWLAGVPLVVHTEHGRQRYATRLRTRWLGRVAGRYASRFFCLTRDMAGAVVAERVVPQNKVRVILNGIDTAAYQQPCDTLAVRQSLGIPPDAPLIGTVGRLAEVKRQDRLIQAFAVVRRRFADAHLLLVGDGPLLHDLRQLATALGVSDRVHFAGFQSPTTPYLRAMDIFALTSRSEGTPQALLEASVAGIAVIGSRVGGIPEVIEHGATGLLFDPDEENSLADGLIRLLTDSQLARRLGQAARERVEGQFDIGRMVKDYQQHFEELLLLRQRRAG
jgi:sugar transferase (PEP-CTERM/EpsH1 system associated)